MIAILDYGLGNVRAIANIYQRLNIDARIARNCDELQGATRLILPGVGSFDWAMTCLNGSGMREAVDDMVLGQKTPVLGICVGMQMMAQRSEEGRLPGLGWIDGEVKRLTSRPGHPSIPLPHMGWNTVTPSGRDGLFGDAETDPRFYFLHSYYIEPASREHILAISDYGGAFACAVRKDNIAGVQFHPEKSHGWGVALLKNYAEGVSC